MEERKEVRNLSRTGVAMEIRSLEKLSRMDEERLVRPQSVRFGNTASGAHVTGGFCKRNQEAWYSGKTLVRMMPLILIDVPLIKELLQIYAAPVLDGGFYKRIF